MVRTSEDRVSLAPADWGGLCSLTLAIVTLLGATLYKLHEDGLSNRMRLTRLESDVSHVQKSLGVLRTDLRALTQEISK